MTDKPSPTSDVLQQKAAAIRLACFDVDGTLTDGKLYLDNEGRETKAFHVHDGQGLVLLRKQGIQVAMITARPGAVAERRGAELGVDVHASIKDKLECVKGVCRTLGIGLDQVAFMGDDLPDYPVMAAVGLSAAPANAHTTIKSIATWISSKAGGDGAARELCDLILTGQQAKIEVPDGGKA